MIKAQTFNLNFTDFNLFKVTKFIKETFGLKVDTKGIRLNFIFTERLSLPQERDIGQIEDIDTLEQE